MRKKLDVYRLLVRKSEGNRPLVWPRCRWVDNIKVELKRVAMEWYG
jgi:hypothetical protein